jgi:hypothetical protein
MNFTAAKPTYTYRAITRLMVSEGILFCITPNVDVYSDDLVCHATTMLFSR